MPEPFSIIKAVDMSPAALGKSVSSTFKGLLVLGIIVGIGFLCWMGYVTFIKPHTNPTPTTSQQATQIYNVYVYPNRKGFSLFSWGTWHLISKDSEYNLTPILKEQVVVKK